MTDHSQHSNTYLLTAGETDAEGRMPLTLVTERIIEVASEHANLMGIGYDALITHNVGWVLSRVSIEMVSYPEINSYYTLTTWIESYNRRFSERNFVMTDSSGRVLGYMRTVWVAMDFVTRTGVDLSAMFDKPFATADLPCPIAKAPRVAPLPEDAAAEQYTFKYRDLDFNRHVNTVRYLDLILNHWSLEHYDVYEPRRFDIMFHHECHYGDTVDLRVCRDEATGASLCEIVRDGTRCIVASIQWKKL